MAHQNLLIADDNGTRTITINRPDQINALNRTSLVFGSFVQRR